MKKLKTKQKNIIRKFLKKGTGSFYDWVLVFNNTEQYRKYYFFSFYYDFKKEEYSSDWSGQFCEYITNFNLDHWEWVYDYQANEFYNCEKYKEHRYPHQRNRLRERLVTLEKMKKGLEEGGKWYGVGVYNTIEECDEEMNKINETLKKSSYDYE